MGFTRQPRFWGLILTLLLSGMAPLAQAATACEQAEQTLIALEREEQQLASDRQRLQTILNGEVPAPQQLEGLLGQPLAHPDAVSGNPPAKRQSTARQSRTTLRP